MGMPDHLVFVRHGESEGNVAMKKAGRGDTSDFTEEFRATPGRQWKLTELGVTQAQAAGTWIKENVSDTFDRYYVSPFRRTRQTAAHLGLEDAQWKITRRVRERDWGEYGSIPKDEYPKVSESNIQFQSIDFLYWRPPAGESMADLQIRARLLFDTLHRECNEKKVVVVSHGEFIDACRAELEYLDDDEWDRVNDDVSYKIYNAQVLHYSRIDPDNGERAEILKWYQNVCPWADEIDESWHEIKRKSYSNEELLNN
jgi:broad specificity phosphatase PhoE